MQLVCVRAHTNSVRIHSLIPRPILPSRGGCCIWCVCIRPLSRLYCDWHLTMGTKCIHPSRGCCEERQATYARIWKSKSEILNRAERVYSVALNNSAVVKRRHEFLPAGNSKKLNRLSSISTKANHFIHNSKILNRKEMAKKNSRNTFVRNIPRALKALQSVSNVSVQFSQPSA